MQAEIPAQEHAASAGKRAQKFLAFIPLAYWKIDKPPHFFKPHMNHRTT